MLVTEAREELLILIIRERSLPHASRDLILQLGEVATLDETTEVRWTEGDVLVV